MTAGTDHDAAGNRRLFIDQYAQLLPYDCHPPVTGVRPTPLGLLREAARVFDPTLLAPLAAELAQGALARPAAGRCGLCRAGVVTTPFSE